MVPVTVAYFGSSPTERSHAMRHASFFALGIIAAYTVLGLALAAAVGAAGLNRFAADPRVNLSLGFLFLLFAGNLFGWFELRLPWRILNAADHAAARRARGSGGAFLIGATFTLTSLTCTAPVVGTLLVLAATGSWTTPLLGMLAYSIAFALPFFLLALVPHAVQRLPRAGEWMHTIRVIIGMLELAAAVKFASNADLVLGWHILTRPVVLVCWSALAFAAAVFLGSRLVKQGERRSSFLRPLAAAGALGLCAWLALGAAGRSLPGVEAFLPPPAQAAYSTDGGVANDWMLNDYDRALAAARTSNKLVFVDFTGYTCTNCRWMEANIFSRPDVAGSLSKFVLSRLYTDGEGEIYERQQAFQEKNFGTVALPLYAIVDGNGKTVDTFSGLTRNPEEFISFLERARARRIASN